MQERAPWIRRNFFVCTWNSWRSYSECPQSALKFLFKAWTCEYLVGQLVKGEDGTDHLKFFCAFALDKSPLEMSSRCFDLDIIFSSCTSVLLGRKACDCRLQENPDVKEGPWEFGSSKRLIRLSTAPGKTNFSVSDSYKKTNDRHKAFYTALKKREEEEK